MCIWPKLKRLKLKFGQGFRTLLILLGNDLKRENVLLNVSQRNEMGPLSTSPVIDSNEESA